MKKKGHERVVINLFAGKEWRHRCREWACGHIGGSRQWDELREWHGQICTTMWTTGMRGKLLGDTRNQLCDDLEGWGGREVHEGGDICILTAALYKRTWHTI